MSLVGAVNARDPESYSWTAHKRLQQMVRHFLFVLSKAEEREANGYEALNLREDCLASAVAIRTCLRPEVAAVFEEECERD